MTAILNKKVLLAASTIVAVAAIALGATYAAWNATAEITGNTVSTAELSITAIGEAPSTSPYPVDAKPIDWVGALPGQTSSPEERAIITNESDVALDLWMYYENTEEATCEATKVAWQSSTPGGANLLGYPANPAPLPTGPGVIGVTTGYFEPVQAKTGIANAFKIADDSYFGNGDVIAVREVAGFATDADYGTHSGECKWKEVFVGTLPGYDPQGNAI